MSERRAMVETSLRIEAARSAVQLAPPAMALVLDDESEASMQRRLADIGSVELMRVLEQSPDIAIPFRREAAAATNLGAMATHECAVMRRAVEIVLRTIAGAAVDEPRPLVETPIRLTTKGKETGRCRYAG